VRHPKTSPDLAWASFQYQDLSLADDRAGLDAARSGSFCPFWKLIQTLRAAERAPRMIVLENVTGLFTSHGGKDFDAISNAIEECGYRAGAVVIDASLFVAQSRERVFVVAVDADEYFPAALVADGPSALFHPPALVTACKHQRDPLWWRLPIPPKRNSTFDDIVEDEPHGVRWHDSAESERPLEATSLPARRSWRRRRLLDTRPRGQPSTACAILLASGRQGPNSGSTGSPDVSGVPTGGSSRQFIVVIENGGVRSRLLSPREDALGLPDSRRDTPRTVSRSGVPLN
jgi:DNA (cytosine-5)-methyltransferase 1